MLTQYTNQQQQLNQIYVRFNGPLNKESVCQSVSDLVNLTYNYDGKLVWVVDEMNFYYLLAGSDGTQPTDWKRFGTSASINPYDPALSYNNNTCVIYNNTIYVSKNNPPQGTAPSNTTYWDAVSATNYVLEVPFTNQSVIVIDLPITQPIFSVYVQDQRIGCDIIDTLQPGSNGGNIWNIKFYQEDQPMLLTGRVIVK